jgi:glutaminyl-peptide cyclotransferase
MRKPVYFFSFLLLLLAVFASCSNRSRKPVSSIILKPAQKDYRIGQPVIIQVQTKLPDGELKTIDLYYENECIATHTDLNFEVRLEKIKRVGPNSLKVITTKTDGVSNTRYHTFSALSDISPKEYDIEVIREYPHSREFFTQGLEMADGFLYESTGQKGFSAIYKVILSSGKVLQQKELNDQYFGEGITILNNKIYQLTYHARKGFIYRLSDFALVDSFSIPSAEGWGLTNDGENLVMSDGTHTLTWMDPETFSVVKHLYVASDTKYQSELNELEYHNGFLYANVWAKNIILKIDPENGRILATIDLSKLYSRISSDLPVDVLNGIAFLEESGNLLVTGKYWPLLFEVKPFESE